MEKVKQKLTIKSESLNVDDLRFRLALVNAVIVAIESGTDPEFSKSIWDGVRDQRLAEFKQQRKNIETKLEAALLELKKQEEAAKGNVVVGLKTAVLFPVAGNENNNR